MSHANPEFESKDVLGKTRHFNGSVGVSSALIPSVSGDKISTVLIKNSQSNLSTSILYVAFDAGTDYFPLRRGEFINWSPKANNSGTPITQIRILGSAAGIAYEAIMDFEP
jgi:hypothetical protein